MSAQIRKERKAYYGILEATQKGDSDITDWLLWFLQCLERAIQGAEETLESVLYKADFWQVHKSKIINQRQQNIINRLLGDFKGNLT
ncbi:MAG: hypothetical protein JKX72_08170 [Robiginitomaculum sp.]|nr:hypothetical protein [Robiginitomaculum sp.]